MMILRGKDSHANFSSNHPPSMSHRLSTMEIWDIAKKTLILVGVMTYGFGERDWEGLESSALESRFMNLNAIFSWKKKLTICGKEGPNLHFSSFFWKYHFFSTRTVSWRVFYPTSSLALFRSFFFLSFAFSCNREEKGKSKKEKNDQNKKKKTKMRSKGRQNWIFGSDRREKIGRKGR